MPILSPSAIEEYLAAHRVMSGLPRAALQSVAHEVLARHYKKDHYFFRVGDQASHIFAIVSGSAQLSEENADGRDHSLYTLSSGDLFGMAAALLGIPRVLSAKAMTDVDVLLIRRETFDDLQNRYPGFARGVILELCRRLCHSEKSAGSYAMQSVTSRLARFLLDYSPESPHQNFSSHRQLASRVGCSRETVTRTLTRLHRAGIVSVQRGDVTILNRRKLASLAAQSG
jgi:CRP-like cAMP-binding protein